MISALIDVVEWQTTVDFCSGRQIEYEHPLLKLAGEVLANHHYPGDLIGEGSRWVTDTALDVVGRYQPDYVFLNYADTFIRPVFRPLSDAEQDDMIALVFDEVSRFLQETDYLPVIVGTGDLMPVEGFIDLMGLDGLVEAVGMMPHYAGLYGASKNDLEWLLDNPRVAHVTRRQDFRSQYGGIDEFYARFPDYLLVAEEGFVFRGVGSSGRPIYRMSRHNLSLPMHTPLGQVQGMTDVAAMILQALADQQRVALIVVEGVGTQSFPLSYQSISNCMGDYIYFASLGQYMALTSGQHLTARRYPPGMRAYLYDDEKKPFPFSGALEEMDFGTIGERFAGKSAAVGARGMSTHPAGGTDIAVEGFVRALYNHGVMAVVRD